MLSGGRSCWRDAGDVHGQDTRVALVLGPFHNEPIDQDGEEQELEADEEEGAVPLPGHACKQP